MNALVPVSQEATAIVRDGLVQVTGFAISDIRKQIKLANPDLSAKQVRAIVAEKIESEQKFALANFNEGMRRGYKIVKQTISKKGNIYSVLAPPPKAARTKTPAIESLPLEAIVAELKRRGISA